MDGHEFIRDAVARGAAAAIVERKTDVAPGIVEVVVPDAWAALYALAAHALTAVKEAVADSGLEMSDIDGLAWGQDNLRRCRKTQTPLPIPRFQLQKPDP